MNNPSNSILATLVVLLLWRVEEIAEACSCSPMHPQQAFCNADIGKTCMIFTVYPNLKITPFTHASSNQNV